MISQVIQNPKTGKMVTKRLTAHMDRSGLLFLPSPVVSFLHVINIIVYLLIRGDSRSVKCNIQGFKEYLLIYFMRCTSMLFLVLVWSSLAGATQTLSAVLLADKGIALATIVIDADATQRMKEAAQTLADYLQRSTGSKFAISDQPELVSSSHAIVFLTVKSDNFSPSSSILPTKDAFNIEFPNAQSIVISGVSDIGVEFGVYDFLERFLGVRWLFPGEIGIHVPQLDKVKVLFKNIVGTPRYQMRLLSGLKTKEALEWAAKNRMNNMGIKFHHNLANLFPVEIYAKSHPEFFPVINGKRFIPKPGEKSRWQPCFSAPGLVDEAVKRIINYFEKNPDEISFSLGVNDNGGYCNCSRCLSIISGSKNYVNSTDYSVLYYRWANKVAEGVLRKFPDKWFGCIAYREVGSPPLNFNLHPKIIPFIVYDRIKWVDKNSENEGKKIKSHGKVKLP